MEFDPTFALLKKFTVGLPPTPKSMDDVVAVAKYLGVKLVSSSLDVQIEILTDEVTLQNRFLSHQLASDSIFDSDEYSRSMFIREVVTNNRKNLQNRLSRNR